LDGLTITVEQKDVDRMLNRLIKKLDNPKPLLKELSRYVRALTMKMFVGRRPDNTMVRGVKWDRLKDSTLKQKRALVKRGKAVASDRPLVRTGKMRGSLKSDSAIKMQKNGFTYGTDVRSEKGFPYPGLHNKGDGKIPKRKWLFLTMDELNQMAHATKQYLDGTLVKLRAK